MTNFDFLKKIDGNLYEIITEAEKLYTSEFFEQCMGQTRRFGEQMCKSIMADRRLMDGSFDDMIATLRIGLQLCRKKSSWMICIF